jgi:hypothetical protein
VSAALVRDALEEVTNSAAAALNALEQQLPPGPCERLHASVKAGIVSRLAKIRL